MDKEQKRMLIDAWTLHGEIIHQISALANMNVSLAYGCIRTAETMIDMIMVNNIRKKEKDVSAGSTHLSSANDGG